MLFTLRPLILESQGLVAAQQLADKTRDLTGHDVLLEVEGQEVDGLEANRQGLVFFIAEEAVNNARKHAEAEHIWIRMRHEGEALVMEIEDDGVGFNIGAVDATYAHRGSLGMVSMRERTELLGGSLTVNWVEGRGTHVRLTVPLAPADGEGPGPWRSRSPHNKSFPRSPACGPPPSFAPEVPYASTAKGKEDRQDLRRRLTIL